MKRIKIEGEPYIEGVIEPMNIKCNWDLKIGDKIKSIGDTTKKDTSSSRSDTFVDYATYKGIVEIDIYTFLAFEIEPNLHKLYSQVTTELIVPDWDQGTGRFYKPIFKIIN